MSGIGWTTISTITNGLVQILRLSILSRYLTKEDFGLVAILTLILGLSFNSKNSISIDEGMPSEVAIVCLFPEFYRNFSRFLSCQGIVIPCMEDNAIRG